MVDHMLLTHYGPSGIVVDKELRIIEFRGNMNPYLDIRQGEVKSGSACRRPGRSGR